MRAAVIAGVVACALGGGGASGVRRACADDDVEPPAAPAVPAFVPGRVALRAALEAGVPIDDDHEPTSVALDGWYDLNERFRLGLTTSHDARHELGAGRGLCVSAADPGCDPRFGGLALDAQVWLGPELVGRAAIDTTRFAPTVAALELGADLVRARGRWRIMVSPTLRLGVARRDLANTDSGALPAQIALRLWCHGGVLAFARVAVDLGALDDTPSLGAAGGAWVELGAFTLTARAGSAEVARTSAGPATFAELALAWSR